MFPFQNLIDIIASLSELCCAACEQRETSVREAVGAVEPDAADRPEPGVAGQDVQDRLSKGSIWEIKIKT